MNAVMRINSTMRVSKEGRSFGVRWPGMDYVRKVCNISGET